MSYSLQSGWRGKLLGAHILIGLLCAAALTSAPALAQPKPIAENPEQAWVKRVEPILDKYCLKCHAGVRQQGGLDLRSLETILRGGDQGPAMIPGKPNESRLLQYTLPASGPRMPPDPKKRLSVAEVATLKAWISQLPPVKSPLASGSSKNNAWVSEYLADYRRSLQTRPKPPKGLSPSSTIDWLLQADWRRDGITPAKLCDDATFVRRISLDLIGRIPTLEERHRFVVDTKPDKRTRLIAQLTDSKEYARHMRELFDAMLMGRADENRARERVAQGWQDFLESSFRENRPWNETVRDILLARNLEGAKRGAVWFLAERNNSHQAMAEAVAPMVFGVQIKCAQCHNHPLVWEIEQRHYWGMVAAFNRSKNIPTEQGIGVSESAIGGFINFANLKKESQPAALVFLNGKSVAERVPDPNAKEQDDPALYLVPPPQKGEKTRFAAVPKFSRREAFAQAATTDNPQLARAFVNRIWALLMGRGIVHPADQIDSRHRPSHPELLDWLSLDFENSGYNIQRLIRNIVSSRAYQRDSKPFGKSPPLPESFARALEKPLTAEQLLRSLRIATGAKANGSAQETQERAFAARFPEVLPETYSPSLQQALFLTNSPLVDALLNPTNGNALTKLAALKSVDQRIALAFLSALGRAPDAQELQQCRPLFASQTPQKGVKNLLWALLTSAEFQVNH